MNMSVTIVLYFTKDLLSSSGIATLLNEFTIWTAALAHFTGIHKPQTLGEPVAGPWGVHFNLGKGLLTVQTTRKPVQTERLQ